MFLFGNQHKQLLIHEIWVSLFTMGIIGATIMQNKTVLDPNLKNVN